MSFQLGSFTGCDGRDLIVASVADALGFTGDVVGEGHLPAGAPVADDASAGVAVVFASHDAEVAVALGATRHGIRAHQRRRRRPDAGHPVAAGAAGEAAGARRWGRAVVAGARPVLLHGRHPQRRFPPRLNAITATLITSIHDFMQMCQSTRQYI